MALVFYTCTTQVKDKRLAEEVLVHTTAAMERSLPHPSVDISQPPPERACRKAAELHVGAEDRGAGGQSVGLRLRLLEVTHPRLEKRENIKKG